MAISVVLPGCGLCALYRLREIGITHLKLVGRGNYNDYMEQDIRILRRALTLLEQSTSEEDFKDTLRRTLFSYKWQQGLLLSVADLAVI